MGGRRTSTSSRTLANISTWPRPTVIDSWGRLLGPGALNTGTNAFPDGQQPVLQVLYMEEAEEHPGWYWLILSDGQLSIYGALLEGHAALVENGQLAKFSIVKLNRCEVMKSRDAGTILFGVRQLEVVHDASYSGAAQLGRPSHEHLYLASQVGLVV